VIQVLAEQASIDSDLALIKTVRDSKASGDELKKFQGYIGNLTKLEKARQVTAQLPLSQIYLLHLHHVRHNLRELIGSPIPNEI
jgi:hypothetical protein